LPKLSAKPLTKPQRGEIFVAHGKRVLASGAATERRRGYVGPITQPLTAMPREIASGAATANLICGIFSNAMAAGITGHVWSLEEIVDLLP